MYNAHKVSSLALTCSISLDFEYRWFFSSRIELICYNINIPNYNNNSILEINNTNIIREQNELLWYRGSTIAVIGYDWVIRIAIFAEFSNKT